MAELVNFVLGPFAHPFMLRALAAVLMVGVTSAVVGVYVVLRGMAFFGDALAHAILPGVAIGFLAGGGVEGPLFWWGLVTAIFTALGIGAISKRAKIKEDTAIGIVFAGMFALGVALISSGPRYAIDLTHILFGNVLAVSRQDLWLTAVFGGLVIFISIMLYKEFMVVSFDPVLAATLRLPVERLDYLLFVLMAVTIVVSLQTVGVALMVAMLVTPAATAYLLSNRLPVMTFLAALIGTFSGVVGLYISFYLGVASGAAIVLVCTGIFALVFLFAPRRRWRGGGR